MAQSGSASAGVRMTDTEKLSLFIHPDYPNVTYKKCYDRKSGYEVYEAINPEIAADYNLPDVCHEGTQYLLRRKFIANLRPLYKVVLA